MYYTTLYFPLFPQKLTIRVIDIFLNIYVLRDLKSIIYIYCSNQITMTVLDCISHKERFIQLKAPIYFVPYLSLWKQLNDILWLYIFDITSLTNFQTLIYPYHKYHYSPTSNCFFISFLISPFLILSCCLFILFTFICASVIKSISFFSIISLSPKYLVL